MKQGDVGDVGRPHLVGPVDDKAPQQVGVCLVLRRRLRGARLAVDGFDPHQLHQPARTIAAHRHIRLAETDRHLAGSVERVLDVQLVQLTHELEVFR